MKSFIPSQLIVKNQAGEAVFVKFCDVHKNFNGEYVIDMYYSSNFAVMAKIDLSTIELMDKNEEGDTLELYRKAFPNVL